MILPEDIPEVIPNKIMTENAPKEYKLPEWFDAYAEQVLFGDISDDCTDTMVKINSLKRLYGIESKWMPMPSAFHSCENDSLYNNAMYNVLLAVNHLKNKYPDALTSPIHLFYQAAYYLMPPVLNTYNIETYKHLRNLYFMLHLAEQVDNGVLDKVKKAIVDFEFRKSADSGDFKCILHKLSEDMLYSTVDVGGGHTDIVLPVFNGIDPVCMECKLVPTTQEAVDGLLGYMKPKMTPLPEYVDCRNVASVHFIEDFEQRILKNQYTYAGEVSISAYLNSRSDDAPMKDNPLDTFYKFVRCKDA